jgi:hypothetical protein
MASDLLKRLVEFPECRGISAKNLICVVDSVTHIARNRTAFFAYILAFMERLSREFRNLSPLL